MDFGLQHSVPDNFRESVVKGTIALLAKYLIRAAVYDQASSRTTAIYLQAKLLREIGRIQLPCIRQVADLCQIGRS